MNKHNFWFMVAAIAVLMAGVATFTACDKDDDKKEDNTEQKQQGGGDEQGGEEQGIAIEMVTVQGGTFTMGGGPADQGEDIAPSTIERETPTHTVTVSTFAIGKYEVTQKLWVEIMGSNPSYFTGDENRPVEKVSWNDIQEFLTKLNAKTGKNYRLPTEAEWEFAARGGNQSNHYKYSGSNAIDNVAWYWDNSSDETTHKTHVVGQKAANELGIYDMSGNVCEWCSDWYGDYSSSAQTNPKGPNTGTERVGRSGGYNSMPEGCRIANRFGNTPDYRGSYMGFRLAMDVE